MIKRTMNSSLWIVALGSCVYAVCYYLNISNYAQLINCILCGIVAILVGLTLRRKIPLCHSSFAFIWYSFGWMFISGLVQNSFVQMLPSAFRYFSYLAIAHISYSYVLKYGTNSYINLLSKFLKYFILLSLIWMIVEIYMGDVEYLNGANRYSGSFKKHPLATALFAYVLIVLYYSFKFDRRRLIHWIIWGGLGAYLVSTQSRSLLGTFIGVYLLYYFLQIKSLKQMMRFLFLGLIVGGIGYYIIFYTDWIPRITNIFSEETGVYDSSTLERMEIMDRCLNNIKGIHKFTGIGLGGFESFYYSLSGRDGVAAHNNYLLFFVEGGYFSLICYIIFQILLGLKLIIDIRKKQTILIHPAFFLFWGITVLSFLLNNYYFFCSELLVWSIFGAYLGESKYEKGVILSAK